MLHGLHKTASEWIVRPSWASAEPREPVAGTTIVLNNSNFGCGVLTLVQLPTLQHPWKT